jgi:hypothetical protein
MYMTILTTPCAQKALEVTRLQHSINTPRLDTCLTPNPGFKSAPSIHPKIQYEYVVFLPSPNGGFMAWGFPHY